MLLFRRSIRQSAIGTVKKLGRPDTACHGRDDAMHHAGTPVRASFILNDLLPDNQTRQIARQRFFNSRAKEPKPTPQGSSYRWRLQTDLHDGPRLRRRLCRAE